MSDFDLPIQFLEILAVFGGACAAVMFLWWNNLARPPLAIDRRQLNMKVEVERRKGERRKLARQMVYSA